MAQTYKQFWGFVEEAKRALIVQGYEQISVAHAIEKRLSDPVDDNAGVTEILRRYLVYTADYVVYNEKGDAILTLDAPPLRSLVSSSRLDGNSLLITHTEWEEINRRTDVLHLSAGQIKETWGKGYFLKDGIWRPENSIVGKVWDFLGRNRDLTSYFQLTSDWSNTASNITSNRIMNLFFDRSINLNYFYDEPVMRPLTLNSLELGSCAMDGSFLDDDCLLVGVKPI